MPPGAPIRSPKSVVHTDAHAYPIPTCKSLCSQQGSNDVIYLFFRNLSTSYFQNPTHGIDPNDRRKPFKIRRIDVPFDPAFRCPQSCADPRPWDRPFSRVRLSSLLSHPTDTRLTPQQMWKTCVWACLLGGESYGWIRRPRHLWKTIRLSTPALTQSPHHHSPSCGRKFLGCGSSRFPRIAIHRCPRPCCCSRYTCS